MTQTNPLLSGVLYKRGSGGKIFGRRNWKLRYFEFTETKLKYFTSAKRHKLCGEVLLIGDDGAQFKLEMMPLDQVKHSQTSVVPKWRFVVCTPDRELLLAAFSEIEMKTWVQHLGMLCLRRLEEPPTIESNVRKSWGNQRFNTLASNEQPTISASTVAIQDSLHGSFTLDFPDRSQNTFKSDGQVPTQADRGCEFLHDWVEEEVVSVCKSKRFSGSSIAADTCGFTVLRSRREADISDTRRASESLVTLNGVRTPERSRQRSSMIMSVTL